MKIALLLISHKLSPLKVLHDPSPMGSAVGPSAQNSITCTVHAHLHHSSIVLLAKAWRRKVLEEQSLSHPLGKQKVTLVACWS